MSRTIEAIAREREKCAQLCENMVVHKPALEPGQQARTPAETLIEAARRIRAGEFGPVDWTGWEKP